MGEYVDDLLEDQTTCGIAQGLGFAGTFGLVVAMVYMSLHAMRVGLLSRFWGTLGMALGVSILFLGILGILIYFAAMGLLIANRWPRGRPPAWERARRCRGCHRGRSRATRMRADDSDRPADPDEFAATIEGTGSEVEPRSNGAESDEPAQAQAPLVARPRRGRR